MSTVEYREPAGFSDHLVGSDGTAYEPAVTDVMIAAAARKAVDVGLIRSWYANLDDYLAVSRAIKAVVEAAIAADDRRPKGDRSCTTHTATA